MKTGLKNKHRKNRGFSIMEIAISVSLMSVILLFVFSFFWAMNRYNSKTNADSEVLETARRVLDGIVYEVRGAKDVYAPTTTVTQLSLETTRYLPQGESSTFIDFYKCGSAVCFKKEGQSATILTPDSVKIDNLSFSRISNGDYKSVQISLTAGNLTLTSTASLRQY
jgi:type II secretory pathway pseudopilin PulG